MGDEQREQAVIAPARRPLAHGPPRRPQIGCNGPHPGRRGTSPARPAIRTRCAAPGRRKHGIEMQNAALARDLDSRVPRSLFDGRVLPGRAQAS